LHLGAQAGAAIVGHDRSLGLITNGFGPHFDVVPPGWLVYVNREGQRFTNEMAPYGTISTLVKAQSGASAFAILDHATFEFAVPGTPSHMGPPNVSWNNVTMAEALADGRMTRADSLGGLAAALQIDAEGLMATVDAYNVACVAGRDERFAKDPAWMRSVSTAPFYGVEITPCMLALTSCGVRVDHRARALTAAGTPITGLFAAGETTGGVMGAQYAGSGSSIANSLAYGRLAGRSAARSAGHTSR
jgi:fumarate reductase flavoprotein subunit